MSRVNETLQNMERVRIAMAAIAENCPIFGGIASEVKKQGEAELRRLQHVDQWNAGVAARVAAAKARQRR